MSFVARLRPELIAIAPAWGGFRDTVGGLVELLVHGDAVPAAREAEAVRAVVAREAEASTAVLDIGVGVPHARLAGLRETVVALGLSRAGLYEPVPTVVVPHRRARAVPAWRPSTIISARSRGSPRCCARRRCATRCSTADRSGERARCARPPRPLRPDRLSRAAVAGGCVAIVYDARVVGLTNPSGAGAVGVARAPGARAGGGPDGARAAARARRGHAAPSAPGAIRWPAPPARPGADVRGGSDAARVAGGRRARRVAATTAAPTCRGPTARAAWSWSRRIPWSLFAHWEIPARAPRRDAARARSRGRGRRRGPPRLRGETRSRTSSATSSSRPAPSASTCRSTHPGRTYRVEVGLRTPSGRFVALATSNPVATPPAAAVCRHERALGDDRARRSPRARSPPRGPASGWRHRARRRRSAQHAPMRRRRRGGSSEALPPGPRASDALPIG